MAVQLLRRAQTHSPLKSVQCFTCVFVVNAQLFTNEGRKYIVRVITSDDHQLQQSKVKML